MATDTSPKEHSPISTARDPERGQHQAGFEDEPKPYQVPDGGLTAWLSVLGAACGLFCSIGYANAIGVFQAEYERSQLRSFSTSVVSWITSLQYFFMLGLSPIGGKLFDSYGPQLPIAIGTLLHVFGIMMTSLSAEYYQILLSQSVCSGLGSSLIFAPCVAVVHTWFDKKRAVASGLIIGGSSIGGVIFPIMVQRLLPEIGFGWTLRICGFLVLALMIVSVLFTKSNFKHVPTPLGLDDYVAPFREANYSVMCATCFALYWGLFVVFNYIVTEAIAQGVPASSAFNLTPILNGASLFGRTVPMVLADKYTGHFNMMMIMTIIGAVTVLALWIPARSEGALITFAVLFGISSGATFSLSSVLVAHLSTTKEIGRRVGTLMTIAALGALTAPPITGAIVGADNGSYTFAAVFSGLSSILATLGFAALRFRVKSRAFFVKA